MKDFKFSAALEVATGVLLGMAVFSFLDRFVLSKIGNHLENLIEGNEQEEEK